MEGFELNTPNCTDEWDHVSMDPYDVKQEWKWYRYGPEFEHYQGIDFGIEIGESSSVRVPIEFTDNISKGSVLLTIPQNSSNPTVGFPESPWFLDKKQKFIIYSPKREPLYVNSWIEASWCITVQPPELTAAVKFREIFERVWQFAKLKFNWDSYNSPPVNKKCINHTFTILRKIFEWRTNSNEKLPAPFAAPLSNGGIQLEWEENNKYLEIDIEPESSEFTFLAIAYLNKNEITLEGTFRSLMGLKDLLHWFINGTGKDLTDLKLDIDNSEEDYFM